MTTHRPQRVADVIREVLTRALREEVRDPEVGFVTVTGIDLSPDLRHARVFVSVLGGEESRERSLLALRRAAPFLRRAVARDARLRYVPSFEFRADPAVAAGSRVEQLLAGIRGERERSDEEDG